MGSKLSLFLLAQTISDTAKSKAGEANEIITKITTWKVTQALIVLALAYITIKRHNFDFKPNIIR